jgi:hypothetical protein
MNGYGFRKILFTGYPGSVAKPLDFEMPEAEIVVLKLHGSVGWHQRQRAGSILVRGIASSEILIFDAKIPVPLSRSCSYRTARGVSTGVSVFLEASTGSRNAVNLGPS